MPRRSVKSSREATRVERDTMGEMPVPADALYGASTQRAVLNFPISGRPVPPQVIRGFAELKRASAQVNASLSVIPRRVGSLIVKASDRLVAGLDGREDRSPAWWMEQFPVDVFQTGSGTSTNMNANEVISNLACLEAGGDLGDKDPVHPNDHVNQGQSSNDTFPTAMQIAGAMEIDRSLIPALRRLAKQLAAKTKKWHDVVKTGRTHLQDATPVRVGQEFSGFHAQIEYAIVRAERARQRLAENLPIGGTAVGTGINTHPEFAGQVVERLSKRMKIDFREAPNHFEAQATRDCVVEASGELRTIAVSLSKIANDIRWLGSGPRCGLGELVLPATQPGSSIMPGKVNPVICESVIQVCCQVVGHDAAIAMGGFGGVGSVLQLNMAMPMMAWSLLDMIELLARTADVFDEKCIRGLELDRDVAEGYVERSLMMGTSLAPVVGYEAAAALAKEAHRRGLSIRELAHELEVATEAEITEALDPYAMTSTSGPDVKKTTSKRSKTAKKKTKKRPASARASSSKRRGRGTGGSR